MRKTKIVEQNAEHPVEQALDITTGTTAVEHVEVTPSEIIKSEEYDEKDCEIETQFQEVYDAAMDAFDESTRDISDIEPRYRARNHEVAAQYLTAALNAAKEKAALKGHKDKMGSRRPGSQPGRTVNNNLFVGGHNDLLKALNQVTKSNST